MTTIHEAVTEKLGYRKLCARWVPKMLTITKQNGWVPRWSFSHATHRKEMSFWTALWLEVKHGVFTTLLNPSNSYCNGAICIQRAGGRLLWLEDTEAGSKS